MSLVGLLVVCFAVAAQPGNCQTQKKASRGRVSDAALLGLWTAAGRGNGYAKVVIRRVGGEDRVQLWSRRTRNIVPLPEISLQLFSDRVNGHSLTRAMASWKEDFAHGVCLFSVRRGQLALEELTVFTDQSGRTNYADHQIFDRRSSR